MKEYWSLQLNRTEIQKFSKTQKSLELIIQQESTKSLPP